MQRELFNFAHTEYSTYYKGISLSQYYRLSNQKELGNEYIATEAEVPKEESVASVAENISRLMCWNMAFLQQGVQFVRNDKITEYVEVHTRIFAIPWAIKIPGCNDISLVIKFPPKFYHSDIISEQSNLL